ncbi:MAG: 1-acyl-sn-glycerol-3-phosphate acyltransferase [Lachnospiraceae bacterium]|nr:1-acyl-sn-glycerol-3-phosphate acyltransferase [Lachnospiraceae bacterium]
MVYALFIDLEKSFNRHSYVFRFYANCIVASIRQIFRVKVCVSGTKKLPRGKFLLVGNHRSAMDPILEMGVSRDYRIGFVAKQELFKIPVVCKIMYKCFCLSLDRSNPRDGIRAITQAEKIIQSQSYFHWNLPRRNLQYKRQTASIHSVESSIKDSYNEKHPDCFSTFLYGFTYRATARRTMRVDLGRC